MTRTRQPAGRRYLLATVDLLQGVLERQWPAIHRAADAMATALAAGRLVHVFGTGHSHMLAEEMFYRAGGLLQINPILFEGLMLHSGAVLSTRLERLPGLAEALLAEHRVTAGDVLIIASHSGGNTVVREMAIGARERGATVLAITSIPHATSQAARSRDGAHLHELADIAIDSGGPLGDAAVPVDGMDRRMGPTSTVLGAAIANALAVDAAEILAAAGHPADAFASANIAGGDEVNSRLVDRYRGVVRAL